VTGSSGSQTSFIDLGVYTRNRMFRTFLSCKFGKKAILEPSKQNTFPFDDSTFSSIQDFLEASLVVVLKNQELFEVLFEEIATKRPHARVITISKQRTATSFSVEEAVVLHHIRQASRNCVEPMVRATQISSNGYLILNIQNNRYCHRIKRSHRSNNVYYVVDPGKRTFWQKCHDPECNGYSSMNWQYL